MATLAIVPYDGTATSGFIQLLVAGTQSPDVVTGGQQLDSDDTVTIDVQGNDDILLYILDTGGGAVVSVAAGDEAHSPQYAKGADTLTIPDADAVLYRPESGRHIQDDGKVYLTSTQQVLVWVFRLDAGFRGVAITNRETIPAAVSA